MQRVSLWKVTALPQLTTARRVGRAPPAWRVAVLMYPATLSKHQSIALQLSHLPRRWVVFLSAACKFAASRLLAVSVVSCAKDTYEQCTEVRNQAIRLRFAHSPSVSPCARREAYGIRYKGAVLQQPQRGPVQLTVLTTGRIDARDTPQCVGGQGVDCRLEVQADEDYQLG
jgi:hypothetical protein